MQSNNTWTKPFVNHITYIGIIGILLLGLPLEGCLENHSSSISSIEKPTSNKFVTIKSLPFMDQYKMKLSENFIVRDTNETLEILKMEGISNYVSNRKSSYQLPATNDNLYSGNVIADTITEKRKIIPSLGQELKHNIILQRKELAQEQVQNNITAKEQILNFITNPKTESTKYPLVTNFPQAIIVVNTPLQMKGIKEIVPNEFTTTKPISLVEQLSGKVFKTRQEKYTVRFTKEDETWQAEVREAIGFFSRELKLPVYVGLDTSLKQLNKLHDNGQTTTSLIRVVLPSSFNNQIGYVYVGTELVQEHKKRDKRHKKTTKGKTVKQKE